MLVPVEMVLKVVEGMMLLVLESVVERELEMEEEELEVVVRKVVRVLEEVVRGVELELVVETGTMVLELDFVERMLEELEEDGSSSQ